MYAAWRQRWLPNLPPDNFRAEAIESMSFPDAFAALVISSAVLHFARDEGQFRDMLQGTWRVLRPGGYYSAALLLPLAWSIKYCASQAAGFCCPTARNDIW
jgi:SAM-dependent methyltransferase